MKTLASILLKLRSWYRVIEVELQRNIDHNWRRLTGAPTLSRSTITPYLFLGGQYYRHGISVLKHRGVTAIVNMRLSQRYIPDLGQIKYLHLPTKDRYPPTLEQLQRGVAFITEEISQNGKVYIHCAYGETRGPTMVIAYLVSTGMSVEDALLEVQKVRSFANPTPIQIQQLQAFRQQFYPVIGEP